MYNSAWPICYRRRIWLEFWGGRMASAEGGSVPNGVGYGEGCPLSSRLGGLGSVMSSPSGVRGRAPAENGFWRILKATERSFLYLYDKNLRGTICTSVPYSKFWGGLVPRVPPWSTPMSVTSTAIMLHASHLQRDEARRGRTAMTSLAVCSWISATSLLTVAETREHSISTAVVITQLRPATRLPLSSATQHGSHRIWPSVAHGSRPSVHIHVGGDRWAGCSCIAVSLWHWQRRGEWDSRAHQTADWYEALRYYCG